MATLKELFLGIKITTNSNKSVMCNKSVIVDVLTSRPKKHEVGFFEMREIFNSIEARKIL